MKKIFSQPVMQKGGKKGREGEKVRKRGKR